MASGGPIRYGSAFDNGAPRVRVALLLFPLLLLQSACASLGQAGPAGSSMPTSAMVDCGRFARNPDGSWRVLETTKLGAATLVAGRSVDYGVIVNGVDLTVILNGKCAAQR